MPPSARPTPIPPDSRANTLQRLRRISHILDNSIPIPGTGQRIGIDPILGLIPGGGDTISGILSAYIVVEAARLGLPRETLMQMAGNIVFETLLGTVPMLGDVFDATYKANARNIALLERHVEVASTQSHRRKADTGFIVLLVIGLAIVTLGVATLSVFLVRWLLLTLGVIQG